MAIIVKELRLSLIWTKGFLRDTNLPVLSDPDRYKVAFDKARSVEEGPWLLPWVTGHRQHFWQYYLQAVEPANFEAVSASNARLYFVPLRLPPCAKVVARDGTVATLEGFCFPHSVGIVATIHVRPDQPLELLQMVDAAVAARNADFQLTWKDKTPPTHSALQSLADKIVERVHTLALKDPTAVGKPLSSPITIATVIDADVQSNPQGDSGTPPAKASSDDDSLGLALSGLCLLQPGWRTIKSHPVDPQSDQLVAIERGRAVWLPHRFSALEMKGRKTALGCYHRNLTLASLQTAALTGLIGRADEVLRDPKGQLLLLQRQEVAQAIDLLLKLERGDYETYRTWSLKHQIGFHDERIQRVRKKLGL